MNQASHQIYNQTKVTTASPGSLIIMLYEGAIKFLKKALVSIDEKNLEAANNNIIKAEAIIVELMSSLKMDIGGEIAKNLFMIYDFIYHSLVEANTKKDKEKLEKVLAMLESMKLTWQEVIKKETENKTKEKNPAAPPKAKSFNLAV